MFFPFLLAGGSRLLWRRFMIPGSMPCPLWPCSPFLWASWWLSSGRRYWKTSALPSTRLTWWRFPFCGSLGCCWPPFFWRGARPAPLPQIGAMKVNQELDAIRTLGLDPVELLVLPRVMAMMVSLPVLTFVGMMAGMVGGAVVCALALDIPPSQFMAIVERDIALKHFLVGIGKAPVFAFLIAVIGCLEGFKVSGSAQSVGEHTTSSVVQSIFMVILLDSVAALFFMEMGW